MNPTVSRVLDVEIMQMSVKPGGKGPWNVLGDIIVELEFLHIRTQAEQWMSFDHFQAGPPADDAVRIRIRVTVWIAD